ncbi:putative NBD/HSP70 family sugar kinase [Salana multivorans]|uniref:Putative NBD/HSP70 family sugar kinase n=1 Tax=Salana multivorans TaxID=120377 RepID=A0A3N2DCQ1_9MICO|nr:ROK family transcriptional regulator [Salana multivorans]OJX97846.1 MAG: transcriptional regulator [Micrococcales bacterium 73-15]ROR97448.1 putative NBD/HSP70 family sugar kinase [Salana multivorans]
MSWQSGSQTSLREANRGAILEAVKRFGGLTQVELVGATGLSPATVSTIVKELTGSGLVEVQPTSRSGRRAQLVTLARRVGLAAGIQVGPRTMRVALADFTSEVCAEQVLPLPFEHRMDTTLDRAALLVVDMLEREGSSLAELVGVGVGLPAPVDVDTGMISVRGIMRGWDDEHIAHVMTKRLEKPVYVDNDANLGALAEATLGAGRGVRDLLYVSYSHSVGAGVVIGGRLHRGFAGTAGEIGHVQVDPMGAICRCGSRGCLETVVRSDALLATLQASHGSLSLRDVLRRAQLGDPGCSRVIADAGEAIGSVLAGACQTLNPQLVIVGGEMAEAGETLLDPMRRELRRSMLPNVIAPVEVVTGDLGARAEIMGAVATVLQHTDVTETGGER